MINHNNEAILIDFGVSALVDHQEDDSIRNGMGSKLFFAPEMYLQDPGSSSVKGSKTDLWALGVTLFYTITGDFPFKAKSVYDLRDKVLNEDINFDVIKNQGLKELL